MNLTCAACGAQVIQPQADGPQAAVMAALAAGAYHLATDGQQWLLCSREHLQAWIRHPSSLPPSQPRPGARPALSLVR